MDFLKHARDAINQSYGDYCDIASQVPKDLLKFGYNRSIGTTKATLMNFIGSEINETYVSTNIIDTISSSSTSDTEVLAVEGHTIDDDGNFTFVIQMATLNGRNKVVLSTPLARCSRATNTGATNLVGNIYVYEDTAITNGVPSDGTKNHAFINSGQNNTNKAATTISSTQYMVLTNFYADFQKKAAGFATIYLEIRLKGSVFIEKITIAVSDGNAGSHDFKPYMIVPKNADIRMTAKANTAGTDISGGFEGMILTVR